MSNMGERLKKLRKKHGYTQKDIANFLDISQTLVAKIENNERNLKLTKLLKLCDLYDVNEEYVLYGEPLEEDEFKVYIKKSKGISIETMYRMNKICRNLHEMSKIYDENYPVEMENMK